jgi:hypothetical protein
MNSRCIDTQHKSVSHNYSAKILSHHRDRPQASTLKYCQPEFSFSSDKWNSFLGQSIERYLPHLQLRAHRDWDDRGMLLTSTISQREHMSILIFPPEVKKVSHVLRPASLLYLGCPYDHGIWV